MPRWILPRDATADPQIPVEIDRKTRGVVILVNSAIRLLAEHCPFCGDALTAGGKPPLVPLMVLD